MNPLSGTVLVIMLVLHVSHAVFSPNVTVESCVSHRVVVRLVNAANGGLVYIQGRGPGCSQSTLSDTREYAFDFDTCDLKYDEKFRVVVQQRPHWQTGYDKVIPVMCLVDTSDLKVSGVIYPEETSDNALNKTTKPSVLMGIQAVNGDGVNLREITLNDNVKMIVRLEEQYLHDFDIKAKDCTASLIPVITDECSSDEELFPNFNKETQGVLVSDFNAFVPTNHEYQEEVDVSFTCNVAVCKGTCRNTVCGEIVGWGKRKRDADDDVIESVTCGTTVRVKSPHIEGHTEAKKVSEFCAEKTVVSMVSSVTLVTLLVSWAICCCILSKNVRLEKKIPGPKKPSKLRRLSEINANFARSVGRRLSTMLNLPVGYDMQDPKMMDGSSQMYPSPPTNRRDSVTVSSSSANEHTDTDDVSIGTSCTCVLRQRLVSSASQTDSDKTELGKRQGSRAVPASPMSHMRTNNPITSLSIKSFVRNDSIDSNSLMLDSETVQDPIDRHESVFGNNDDNRIYFTADEIPRNRERSKSMKRSGNFEFDETSDYVKENTAKTSNITTFKVQNQSRRNYSRDLSDNVSRVCEPHEEIYLSLDHLPDVFDSFDASDCVDGRMPASRDEKISRDLGARRGTSVLNSFVSSSKKTLSRVSDKIASGLQPKNGFDLKNVDLGISNNTVCRERNDYTKNADDRTKTDSNNPESIGRLCDGDEHVYEPIYFVDQVTLHRKLSTHV